MVQANSMTNNKEKIIVIGGPTCIGKSDYAVELALKYNGEVVGADSVQVYKYFDIGSGKITEFEMKGVPHHLISIKDPRESFTVVDFLDEAKRTITDIIQRNKLPIIVGGTGFYINSLLHNYNCGPSEPNEFIRERLKNAEKFFGDGYLYDKLKIIEPDTIIKPNDMQRITRRLELYFEDTNFDDFQMQSVEAYDALFIVMDADRDKLDQVAERRIMKMLSNGLRDEVERLEKFADCRCMASVGYAELFVGKRLGYSDEQIIEHIKQSYHTLIKKQQTFFRWLKWNNRVDVYNWDYSESNKAVEEFLS